MKTLFGFLFSLLALTGFAADVNETNIPVATYLAPTDYVRVLTNGAAGLANAKTRIAPISLLPSAGGAQVWTNDNGTNVPVSGPIVLLSTNRTFTQLAGFNCGMSYGISSGSPMVLLEPQLNSDINQAFGVDVYIGNPSSPTLEGFSVDAHGIQSTVNLTNNIVSLASTPIFGGSDGIKTI